MAIGIVGAMTLAAALPGSVAARPQPAAPPRVIHAAPDGSDKGRCDAARPCTLVAAQRVARRLARRDGVTVQLAGGTYRLSVPLTFTDADSGRPGHPIAWRAAPGATPVLSGGRAIGGWAPFDPARNIWRAPLTDPAPYRTLSVNGLRAERTRTTDQLPDTEVTATGFKIGSGLDMSGWRNLQDVELIRLWQWQMSRCFVTAVVGGEVRVAPTCLENSRRVDLGLYLENAFELLRKPGQWYLDRTGAVGGAQAIYYIPRAGEDMAKAIAELAVTDQLVVLAGTTARPVHDLVFEGLTFAHAGWRLDRSTAARVGGYSGLQAGVYLVGPWDIENYSRPPPPQDFGFYAPDNFVYVDYVPGNVSGDYVRNVRFAGNVFEHLGASALALVRGIKDVEVSGNRFSDISGSAIQIGGVEPEDHHPCGDVARCDHPRVTEGNLIADNRIDHAAVEFQDTVGIFAGYVRDTRIEHNALSWLPYTAISLGYGWGYFDAGSYLKFRHPTITGNNRIVGNDISHHQRVAADGAGIYTLSAQPGSLIAENYVHDVRQVYIGGIYLDEGSSGITVTNNVVSDATFFSQTNCGRTSNNFGNVFRMNYSHNGAVYRTCHAGRSMFTERVDDNVYEPPQLYWQGAPPPAVRAIIAAAGPREGRVP
jgi:hypothetical protein